MQFNAKQAYELSKRINQVEGYDDCIGSIYDKIRISASLGFRRCEYVVNISADKNENNQITLKCIKNLLQNKYKVKTKRHGHLQIQW